MSKTLFCSQCDSLVAFNLVTDYFDYTVKNEIFQILGTRAFCKLHNEELFHLEFDTKNQENAFELYRNKHNIVSPSKIKEIRNKYNLSQKDFSRLLGFGEITISRYERGSLPTKTQSDVIIASDNPDKMLDFLNQNRDKIDNDKANELQDLLNQNLNDVKFEKQIIEKIHNIFNTSADIYSGFKHLDYKKLMGMVLFFAQKEKPYITKLNKLLFYSDFYYFSKFGSSISGSKYCRDYYGPVPNKFQTLFDQIDEIDIIETDYGNKVEAKINTNVSQYFTEDEYKTLLFVYNKFKNFTSAHIKDFSHQEKCWIEVSNKSLIPYNYANDLNHERTFCI